MTKERKKPPKHQFVVRIPEELSRRIQKKSFDLDITQNFLAIECIRLACESDLYPKKKERKPRNASEKNPGTMVIGRLEKRNYRTEKAFYLFIEEELLVKLAETAKRIDISPDRMIAECIRKSKEREENKYARRRIDQRKGKEKRLKEQKQTPYLPGLTEE